MSRRLENRATPAQDIVNASIDAGRINYDSAAWADCVAEARATSCDGLTFADILRCACPEAIQGTVADGGDCLFWQLFAEQLLLETEGACGGVCTPKPAAGEACESDEACIDDVCTGVCAVKVEVGEPCDANDMSEDGSAPGYVLTVLSVVDEGSGMAQYESTPSFTAEVGDACTGRTGDSLRAERLLWIQSRHDHRMSAASSTRRDLPIGLHQFMRSGQCMRRD